MGGKTVYDKDVFTRQDVAEAYDAAYGKILGAHLIHEVGLKMNLHNLSEIKRTDLSESARECIEWGLINSVTTAKKNYQEQHDAKIARLLARLQEEVEQARKDGEQSGKKTGGLLDG